jgi:negative modulator of initiation of replication
MRTIELDEDIYAYLCSQTHEFGETPSSILRRLLSLQPLGETEQCSPTRWPEVSDAPPEVGGEAKGSPVAQNDSHSRKDWSHIHPTSETQQPSRSTSQVSEFLQTRAFTSQGHALGRFLALLSWLYQQHGEGFGAVAEVRGRRRIFFARTSKEIELTGSSTKPQPIPGTPWYVATNNSTSMKQRILKKVMARLGYAKESVQTATGLVEPDPSLRRSY